MSHPTTVKANSAPWMLLHALLLLCLALLTQTASAAERRVALLIGNAKYQHEKRLDNPINDAELLGSVLRDTLKFDDVRIERNLSVHAMDKAVKDFALRAQGADSVVFYYSGHGIKSPDRRSFLLPIDARTGTGDAPELDRQAVSAENIRDKLKAANARVTLVILDACRDGPGSGKSGSKGLARIGGANGLLVAYATEEDQVAQDGQGQNSPYAQALAQALKRTDLPLLAQFDLVGDEVRRKYPSQAPTREGNLRADAYLVSPFGRVNPQDQTRLEDEAWALCKAGATASPCTSYLEDYPQGRYAKLARTRIKDMEGVARVVEPRVAPAQFSAGQTSEACVECPEMVAIPGGSFEMGSNDGGADENPIHSVSIKSFELGKYEVTQGQWKAAMGSNPSKFTECGDSCPVEQVSWDDIQEYIKKLNAKSGQQYRLPSEAEWEYAARAGSSGKWSFGSDEGQLGEYGWYSDNSASKTHPVGQKKPNAFGVYDLHGNVWEWVQDCWHENYNGSPSDGRAWTRSCSDTDRVFRGGGWYYGPANVRSADRVRGLSNGRVSDGGFRLARTLLTP